MSWIILGGSVRQLLRIIQYAVNISSSKNIFSSSFLWISETKQKKTNVFYFSIPLIAILILSPYCVRWIEYNFQMGKRISITGGESSGRVCEKRN